MKIVFTTTLIVFSAPIFNLGQKADQHINVAK